MRTTTTSRCWRAEQNERYLNLYEAMLEGSDKGSLVWTTITTQKAFKMILDRYPDCDYLGDNGHDDSTAEAGEDQRPDLEDEDDDENNDAAVTTPKADEAVSQQGVRAEGLQRKERRSARPTTRSWRTIELSKESPRSPNLSDVETLDSKGDVILSLDIPEPAQPKKYLASSSVLLLASPVFQRKLAPVFVKSGLSEHAMEAMRYLKPDFASASSWKDQELLRFFPEAVTAGMRTKSHSPCTVLRDAILDVEGSLRQSTQGNVIHGARMCAACDLTFDSRAEYCPCGQFLLDKCCTVDSRVSEYFFLLRRHGLYPVEAFSTSSLHEIGGKIR
ncbi:hypothetical protein NKR19_g4203 [Coniochaeta hoffmannii]|uniref:BTB domain-containing protein n=1 Tax=Coniochaeta hoffmannii TaxID=91930 RepID=A0AA38S5T0_9PEZI|nr:hypothetical protein NKR19_g4203 [Coniochaeta hoffmannii]